MRTEIISSIHAEKGRNVLACISGTHEHLQTRLRLQAVSSLTKPWKARLHFKRLHVLKTELVNTTYVVKCYCLMVMRHIVVHVLWWGPFARTQTLSS